MATYPEKFGTTVSRIVRALPESRAAYSFGDLLYWHLFVYGTRPGGDPAAPAGREWDAASFCRKLNITDRTLRNWMAQRSLPDSSSDLAVVLFGDNPLFDPWRSELSEALRAARLEKSRKSRSDFRVETDERPDAASEAEAAGGPEPSGEAGRQNAPESSSSGAARPAAALVPYVRAGGGEQTDRGGTVIHPSWSSRSSGVGRAPPGRLARMIVPGLVILLGVYAWTRPADHPWSGGIRNPEVAVPPTQPPSPPEPAKHATRDEKPPAPVPELRPPATPTKETEQPKPEPPPRAADPKRSEDERRIATEQREAEARKAAAAKQAADDQRIALAAITARQQAFDADRRARDE